MLGLIVLFWGGVWFRGGSCKVGFLEGVSIREGFNMCIGPDPVLLSSQLRYFSGGPRFRRLYLVSSMYWNELMSSSLGAVITKSPVVIPAVIIPVFLVS